MRIRGFTILELIIIIIFLGIMAAVALPRFVNLSEEAGATAHQNVVFSLNSALTALYAKAQVPPSKITVDPATNNYQGPGIPKQDRKVTALDLDASRPNGSATYLWFNLFSYPVGGSLTATRTNGIITTQIKQLIWGQVGDTFQDNCNSIFNALSAYPNTHAGRIGSKATYYSVPLGTLLLAGNNTYQSMALGNKEYPHGACLWSRGMPNSTATRYYILYSPYHGQFYSITASDPGNEGIH